MTTGPGQNPYLFVVGCLRSGTTLLQRMLDSHPQLAVGYDCHFIPQGIRRVPVGVDPPLRTRLVERVRRLPRFARLGLPDTAVAEAAANATTYSEFVSGVYRQCALLHGKALAGEKAPGYCRHLPHLHALFPWVRTIHLVRDGRDVALSVLDWGKGPARLPLFRDEPVAACALWWRRDVTTAVRDGGNLPPDRFHQVRYETLVCRPEPTLRILAEFLDLPFAAEMLTFHEGKTRDRPGRSAKAAWLPPTPGLRDWRAQMAERDLELFEAIAGDVLEEMGYERAIPTISPGIAKVAEHCRQRWKADLETRPSRARSPDAPRSSPVTVTTFGQRPGRATTAPARPAPTVPTPPPGRSSEPSPNPYVFIVGCPRSGTTLLSRMIDAHPQIAIINETRWIAQFYKKRKGLTPDGQVTPALIDRLLEYDRFSRLEVSRADLEALIAGDEPISFARLVSEIFDLYAQRRRKRLAGDKTPRYVRHLPVLRELWPEARIIHLIRDGRDTCLSVLNWRKAPRALGRFSAWSEDPVSTVALWWKWQVQLGRETAEAAGPQRYCEIRYESLVADPAEACRTLCMFLDLPADDSMLRYHVGRQRTDPGLSAKSAWLPPTPGLRDFRSQMSARDVERFEAVAGDLLEELGYPRAVGPPKPEQTAHASSLRDRFSREVGARGLLLPHRWQAS